MIAQDHQIGEHRGYPSIVIWLIGGMWTIGLVVLLGDALLVTPVTFHLKMVRAVLMAIAGAAMSALIWGFIVRRRPSAGHRIVTVCAAILLAVTLHVLLDWGTTALVNHWSENGRMPVVKVVGFGNPAITFLLGLLVQTNIAILATLHAVFGIAATALYSAMETRERERLLGEARAATASAQLAMLRYQINPHFVFNTLNAIGSLVESGRNAQAGIMIERLSDFLRSSLSSDGETFSTLEEELATVESYLEIEAVRFGERLHVHFDVDRDVGKAVVPSFLLQPLIENAIKHAVAPAMRLVTVCVSARAEAGRLTVTVADDGLGERLDPALRAKGAGVGLMNIRERLALLHGPEGQLKIVSTEQGYSARIRMPLSFPSPATMP